MSHKHVVVITLGLEVNPICSKYTLYIYFFLRTGICTMFEMLRVPFISRVSVSLTSYYCIWYSVVSCFTDTISVILKPRMFSSDFDLGSGDNLYR